MIPNQKVSSPSTAWTFSSQTDLNLLNWPASRRSSSSEYPAAEVCKAIWQKHHPGYLIISLGAEGMLHSERGKVVSRIPTYAREVFDVTGAGDTVIASLATAMAAGSTIEEAVHLANTAAGVVVAHVGAAVARTRRKSSTTQHVMSKALFLDRDGTLIVDKEYLSDPEEIELLPGVDEALRRALNCDYQLFLLTNQSGVGRGWYSIDDVHACNRRPVVKATFRKKLERRDGRTAKGY